jgi:uncharacterized protein YceK
MRIKTIKDLKESIKELPDDMPVMGYKGGNGDVCPVSAYDNHKWMSEEEIEALDLPYTYIIDVD